MLKITNKNEAKTMAKRISCKCKCKFNSTACNSNEKKWKTESQYECKEYRTCKKYYSWNPSIYICENSKYLKSLFDDSKVVCDEIINAADGVSTNVTITISTNVTNILPTNFAYISPTNVMSIVSINFHNKKVRSKMYCYILHIVLLLTKLLFISSISCYHYANHSPKLKNILR